MASAGPSVLVAPKRSVLCMSQWVTCGAEPPAPGVTYAGVVSSGRRQLARRIVTRGVSAQACSLPSPGGGRTRSWASPLRTTELPGPCHAHRVRGLFLRNAELPLAACSSEPGVHFLSRASLGWGPSVVVPRLAVEVKLVAVQLHVQPDALRGVSRRLPSQASRPPVPRVTQCVRRPEEGREIMLGTRKQ